MRHYWFILVLFITGSVLGQTDNYMQVEVSVSDPTVVDRLLNNGIDLDHAEFDKTGNVKLFISDFEAQVLDGLNVEYDILIPDYRAYYLQMVQEDSANLGLMVRNSRVADGFDLGSMGGFYTLAEVESKLDEMFANYPNIVAEKTSIGNSIEGRPIWMVKISDNPNVNENEPTAHFDALHHAREPLSMATTINYMFWLLENYGQDPAVTYLVDNRELYFVPVVNPDGYLYNEFTDPDGGGLWRKNRRPDPGGCFGVDLNRNYGFGYANNNNCSSTDPCSNIYRGTGPFSEPESIAIQNFIASTEPATAFSTHSTAGSYLMPYGFDTQPPDFEIYSEWASAFLSENDYPYGVTFQMLGYTSCGTTRDYMHSEGIYAWTPEIDGLGFWPPPSTIFSLVSENIYPMFYQSWISGGYAEVQSYQLLDDALVGQSFELEVELKNVGVGGDANDVTVRLATASSGIAFTSEVDYGTIAARQRKDNSGNPFVITIDSEFEGSSFDLLVNVYQGDALNGQFIVPVEIGETTLVFEDDSEGGSTNWISTGNGLPWDTVFDDSFSGIACFGDSNGGNGQNDTLNFFELDQGFDLSEMVSPLISFNSKYSIESDDQVAFEISTDNGSTWESLRNYSNSSDWFTEIIYLGNYAEESDVRFRFSLFTDGFIPADGFYFDDFKVIDYNRELLSTSDRILADDLVVFPNPFSEAITLKIPSEWLETAEKVELFDLNGRLLDWWNLNNRQELTISFDSRLKSGLYLLRLATESGQTIVSQKLIKK